MFSPNMVKKALIAIVAALVLTFALLGVMIAMQPDEYTVTRKASIAAPPERIFDEVNDFRRWADWSPWSDLDPGMKLEISDPSSGVGSTYYWAGNQEVGEGKMTIVESKPPAEVRVDLAFIRPFDARSDVLFEISPSAAGSDVVWTMKGQQNFMSKAFSLFVDMDKAIGADLERGLSRLKAVTEKQ